MILNLDIYVDDEKYIVQDKEALCAFFVGYLEAALSGNRKIDPKQLAASLINLRYVKK